MFGKFGFNFLFFFYMSAWSAQVGTVLVEETYVYLNPDFDAQVIATAKRGETFQMSDKTSGPFYKVRMKDKRLGWISSVDIQPGTASVRVEIKKEKPLQSHVDEQKAKMTFAILRYQGFFLQSLDWKEKTLGKTRKDNLQFYGWNWTGFDTLVEGPFYIDTRAMIAVQPPDYYEKVTGVKASGWILKAQTSFISANPVGENFLFHYGMGLTSTFSHFKLGVLVLGNKKNSTAEDLTIGVVVPLGFSYRLGPVSTQVFYQYYLEKIQTAGYSLGINWAF